MTERLDRIIEEARVGHAADLERAKHAAAMAPAAPVARGFGYLPCLYCGEEGCITVDLVDLDQFRCCECDREFSRAEVEETIAKWARVLAWIDTAPAKE